jgi:uncharacterized protein
MLQLMTKKFIVSIFFLVLSMGTILRGQPPVPARTSPPKMVNDFANLLSADEQIRLERELVAYNDSTSTQIAVVTIADLGDYDIVDWAVEIGKKWGVGTAQKNNGVVILVGLAPKKKVFIATGGGVQGFLPDIICKRIIEQKITPAFKEKRFYDGFDGAFQVIRGAAKGEFVNENQGKQSGSDGGFWIFIIIMVLVLVFIMYMNNRRGGYAQYTSNRRSYGNGGGGFIFWGGGGGSGWGGGSDDSGGGSFGGFGGGDFDGGGAGGDW